MTNKKADTITKPSEFEQSIKELEQVLNTTEQGNISLSESLAHYEKGVKLIRQCQEALENAEQTLHVLNQSKDNLENED